MTRSRARCRVQVLLVAALLLVPSLLAGHFHSGSEGASPSCVSCIATRHTPTTGAVLAPALDAHLPERPFAALPEPIVSTESYSVPTTGRSPPFFTSAAS